MSISSQVSRVTYTGTGSTNTYSYTFKIFDDDDLVVLVSNISTGVETTLTKTTDYTVTGVGETSGGTIVLVNSGQAWLSGANLANTHKIFIRRKPSIIQETDIRNQGAYFPESIEDQFDKQTFIDQAQQDEIDRSVKLPTSIIASTFNPTLPVDIAQASRAIVTNPGANGFAVGPTTSEISNAQSNALLAEDWATKTDGIVDATDYSSKAWAIGGTGVDDTLGRGSAKDWATLTSGTVDTADYSAKEYAIGTQGGAGGSAKSWATETGTDVDGVDYSSKEYAIGTQRRGLAGGGSAKDWANYVNGVNTVDDTEFSAKKYAQDAAQSAIDAAAAASASQWSDVVYVGFADSPVAVANTDGGKLYAVDCTGGNVVINLPSIATIDLSGAWSIGVKKTDSGSNTITVNPNGSETINGGANKIISRALAGSTFIPDADQTPDDWTSLTFGEVPIDGAIVGTTDTQDLSNKTFVDAITLTEIATPSTPASGDKKFYAKTDGKLYTLNDLGEEVEVGSGGGSGGGKNYFENPEFEVNIDGVTTYDDAGAYVDGTGGSPSAFTVSHNTTTPLAGSGDLQISKSATSGSGEGVTLTTVAIHRADRGENLIIQFEWDGTAANYVDGDLSLKAFSTGTDNVILPVYPIAGLNDDGSLPKQKTKIVAYVPTSSDTDSLVRVSLHCETDNASASAYDVYVDSFKTGPDMVVPGVYRNETTLTASGDFTGGTLLVSRVGGVVSIKILTALTYSSASSATTAAGFIPEWARPGASASNVTVTDSTTVYQMSVGTTGALSVLTRDWAGAATNKTSLLINGAMTYAVQDNLSAQLSTTEASFQTPRLILTSTDGVAITSSVNKFTFNNIVEQTGGINYSSGEFIAPKTGYYFVNGVMTSSAAITYAINGNSTFFAYVNGVDAGRLGLHRAETTTAVFPNVAISGHFFANRGDTVDFRLSSTANYTTASSATGCRIGVFYIPDFSTFSVFGKSETIAAASSEFAFSTSGFATGEWAQMTGNSLTLGPGKYMIGGLAQVTDGTATAVSDLLLQWSSANGNNTTSAPSAIVTTGGFRRTRYNRTLLDDELPASTAIYTTTTTTTIYLVPRISFSTAGTGNVEVYLWAERLQ